MNFLERKKRDVGRKMAHHIPIQKGTSLGLPIGYLVKLLTLFIAQTSHLENVNENITHSLELL